jgi:hypothetical protein
MDANAIWSQAVVIFWQVIGVLREVAPGGLWVAFWLWAVNWKKVWPVLAQGVWAPVTLLAVFSAFVWSRIDERSCNCLGFMTLPTFWWQLGSVATLVAVALFCGWLQGLRHWQPADINLEPPAAGHDHHGHGHH